MDRQRLTCYRVAVNAEGHTMTSEQEQTKRQLELINLEMHWFAERLRVMMGVLAQLLSQAEKDFSLSSE